MSKRIPVLLLTILVVGVASGQWLEKFITVPTGLRGCCHIPKHDKFYVWAYGPNVAVLDGWSDSSVAEIALSYCPIWVCYAESTDKAYCADGAPDSVVVLDASADTVIATLEAGEEPSFVVSVPVLEKVYCANYYSNSVTVIDGVADTVLTTVRVAHEPFDLVVHRSGTKVYCLCEASADIDIIDTRLDRVVRTIDVRRDPVMLAYNEETDKLYCTHSPGGLLTVIDCSTDTRLAVIDDLYYAGSVEFNTRHNKVYVVGFSGKVIYVIDGAGDSLLNRVSLEERETGGLCYNPLNDKVYCGVRDSVVVLNGATDFVIKYIPVGYHPEALVWNQYLNEVYVGRYGQQIAVLKDSIPPGVAEGKMGARFDRPVPTICRGVLPLPGKQPADLLDIAGRKVIDLQPGHNDIRHLAPGVYFVRREEDNSTAKVVIQR